MQLKHRKYRTDGLQADTQHTTSPNANDIAININIGDADHDETSSLIEHRKRNAPTSPRMSSL